MCWASSSREKLFSAALAAAHLYQNIHAVHVFFQHPADAAYLPFNAVQPVDQGLVFLRAALFVAAAAGDSSIGRSVRFLRHHRSNSRLPVASISEALPS